jgi:hypothetical protein
MGKLNQDDPDQSGRFIKLAEEREAKGDTDALAKAVKKLAAQPRAKEPAPKRLKK